MVKHATPLGAESNIQLIAKDTVARGLADAIIVSGTATGSAPLMEDLNKVRDAVPDTPIFIGSGTSNENVDSLLSIADGVIVASSLKRQGVLENPVDVDRVRTLVKSIKAMATT